MSVKGKNLNKSQFGEKGYMFGQKSQTAAFEYVKYHKTWQELIEDPNINFIDTSTKIGQKLVRKIASKIRQGMKERNKKLEREGRAKFNIPDVKTDGKTAQETAENRLKEIREYRQKYKTIQFETDKEKIEEKGLTDIFDKLVKLDEQKQKDFWNRYNEATRHEWFFGSDDVMSNLADYMFGTNEDRKEMFSDMLDDVEQHKDKYSGVNLTKPKDEKTLEQLTKENEKPTEVAFADYLYRKYAGDRKGKSE